ncbi:hypothetical protein T265_10648 [Opisthorchis viverrini]|uniref:Uncharacterized protein n=1 Tax=Opisthorchis viverrini TaxID=6198 RepID=A0A074ZCH2_OPIVI|nr:hypothetical protein T265_10648 [Opisthorchis viverrini]KER20900.1 hypothetical protein T265_10648 [Opisthorchis viverrini]
MAQRLECEFTDRRVRGLGDLAVSQHSCFLLVAWHLAPKCRPPELQPALRIFYSSRRKNRNRIPSPSSSSSSDDVLCLSESDRDNEYPDMTEIVLSEYELSLAPLSEDKPSYPEILIQQLRVHPYSQKQLQTASRIGTKWLSDQSARLLTERSSVRTRPLPLDFPCLGLGNLTVSQPLCNLRDKNSHSTVTTFRYLPDMSCDGSTEAEVPPGCPSLDSSSRYFRVGFEPRTF